MELSRHGPSGPRLGPSRPRKATQAGRFPFRRADDTLGVVHTHFLAGAVGGVMVGLVAKPAMVVYPGARSAPGVTVTGLFYGNPRQLLMQLLGLVVVTAYAGSMTAGVLKLVSLVVPLRMSEREVEVGDRILFNEEVFELHHPIPAPEPIEVVGTPVGEHQRAPAPGWSGPGLPGNPTGSMTEPATPAPHARLQPHFVGCRRRVAARPARADRLIANGAATALNHGGGLTPGHRACPRQRIPYDSKVAESSPDAALDVLLQAVSARDLGMTLAGLSFVHGPTVVGSEEHETAHGREEVEAFFASICALPAGFRFEFRQRRWTVHGDVAWLVADGTVIEPGEAESKPYRLTTVLVWEGAGWRLSLWSGAEPIRARPG
ncbi:MAG: nuclear transport factor 2 family protein [Candidatus Dormibacteria bacterium]